jgi:hypothetical protein
MPVRIKREEPSSQSSAIISLLKWGAPIVGGIIGVVAAFYLLGQGGSGGLLNPQKPNIGITYIKVSSSQGQGVLAVDEDNTAEIGVVNTGNAFAGECKAYWQPDETQKNTFPSVTFGVPPGGKEVTVTVSAASSKIPFIGRENVTTVAIVQCNNGRSDPIRDNVFVYVEQPRSGQLTPTP